MEIANVMDDQTKREWSAIGVAGEVFWNLSVVIGRLVRRSVVTNPVGQILERPNDVGIWLLEGKVGKATTLIEVGLVDEVPSTLETVGAFDVIGKSSTLSKRMAGFALGQRSMSLSQTLELKKGVGEGSGIFVFKNGFGIPCD